MERPPLAAAPPALYWPRDSPRTRIVPCSCWKRDGSKSAGHKFRDLIIGTNTNRLFPLPTYTWMYPTQVLLNLLQPQYLHSSMVNNLASEHTLENYTLQSRSWYGCPLLKVKRKMRDDTSHTSYTSHT